MSKFKVGDKVYLNPTSKYIDLFGPTEIDPLGVIGTITEYEEFTFGNDSITVEWGNGCDNYYNIKCLRIARIRNSKLARKLNPNYEEDGKWLILK